MKKRGMLTNTSFNVTQANKKVAELTSLNISCTSNKKQITQNASFLLF